MSTPPDTKLTIFIAHDKLKAWNDLTEECGLQDKKDLLSCAMDILEWAVQETKEGKFVASVTTDTKYIVKCKIFVLDYITANINKKKKPNLRLVE